MTSRTHPDRLSERQLQNTQAGLAAMVEANQTALVSHMTTLLIPIQEGMLDLRTMMEATQRQIDQLHERQEQLERTLKLAYIPVPAEDLVE